MLIVCTPHEVEEFKRAKCTALVRTFDFLSTMLGAYPSESVKLIPQYIWSDSFLKCLIDTCLDPARVGFSLSDLDVLNNLPLKTRTILKLAMQHLPNEQFASRLRRKCVELVDEQREYQFLHEYVDMIKSKSADARTARIQIDWLKLSQLVNG